MLTTIEGIYKNGKVELLEEPGLAEERRVLVTFLENKTDGSAMVPKKGQMLRAGMFPQLRDLTDEDFKAAEFHGDPDDGLDWQ